MNIALNLRAAVNLHVQRIGQMIDRKPDASLSAALFRAHDALPLHLNHADDVVVRHLAAEEGSHPRSA